MSDQTKRGRLARMSGPLRGNQDKQRRTDQQQGLGKSGVPWVLLARLGVVATLLAALGAFWPSNGGSKTETTTADTFEPQPLLADMPLPEVAQQEALVVQSAPIDLSLAPGTSSTTTTSTTTTTTAPATTTTEATTTTSDENSSTTSAATTTTIATTTKAIQPPTTRQVTSPVPRTTAVIARVTTTTRRNTGPRGTPPTTQATTTTVKRTTTTAKATTTTVKPTTTTTTPPPTTTTQAATTAPPATQPAPTTTKPAPTTTQPAPTTTQAPGNSCSSGAEFESVFRDDFNGSSISSAWIQYNSAGNAGIGLRRPSANRVSGGSLIITAQNENGSIVSGGMAHGYDQTYGKYQFKVRTQADPSLATSGVILTWPQSNVHPRDGENNIYETLVQTANRNPFHTFIHEPYGSKSDQVWIGHNADGTQWQTMTMTWTPNRITITREGAGGSQWRQDHVIDENSDDLIPDVPHHMAIQLDAWKKSVDGQVKMEVDYVQIWKYCK